jgi:hypothetical protein
MFTFGLIDNGVLLLCLLAGLDLDQYLPIPRRYRCKAAGAAIGALVGNAISDGVAAIPQGIGSVGQVTSGCLAVLVVLPLLLRRFAVAA